MGGAALAGSGGSAEWVHRWRWQHGVAAAAPVRGAVPAVQGERAESRGRRGPEGPGAGGGGVGGRHSAGHFGGSGRLLAGRGGASGGGFGGGAAGRGGASGGGFRRGCGAWGRERRRHDGRGGSGLGTTAGATLFDLPHPWTTDVSAYPKAAMSDTIINGLIDVGGWGQGNLFLTDATIEILENDGSAPMRTFTPTTTSTPDAIRSRSRCRRAATSKARPATPATATATAT